MTATTLLRGRVERDGDIATAGVPRALVGRVAQTDDLVVALGRYGANGSPPNVPCIVKELYRPLTAEEARQRLQRCKSVLDLTWGDRAAGPEVVQLLRSAPLAALPVDYCQSADDPDRFDAAVLPRVGTVDLEEVKRKPTQVPAKIRAALGDPLNRAHIVRTLAVVLQAASATRLSHLDISDRNIRLDHDAEASACRAYLIDWDEGLESDGLIVPRDEDNYVWSATLAIALAPAPAVVDALALIRYLAWVYSGNLGPMIGSKGDDRQFTEEAVAQFEQRARSVRSPAMSTLWSRIRHLAEALRIGATPNLPAVPRAIEFTIAITAELPHLGARRSSRHS